MDTLPIVPQQATMPTPPEALNHICDICHKGFRSGQALGGHKSMHYRESEAISSAVATTSDLVSCLSCGMYFDSKETLFRHLRTHSETISPDSSHSSSTVSDEAMFDDDAVDSGLDLSKTLPLGWSRRGKRKRTSPDCSGSDETAVTNSLELVTVDEKLEADDYSGLMVLAEVCAEEASGTPLVDDDHVYDDETRFRYVEIGSKRRRLNDEYDEIRWPAADHYAFKCNYSEEIRCKLCNKTFASYQALGGHMTSHNRLKNNSPDHSDSNTEQHPRPHPVYSCNTCDRKFSSFQALGGHKSSQCKDVNNNIHSSADISSVKVNYDLAEPRQAEVHRCNVCNKGFTSYQALGGHVSSHSKYKINDNVDQDQSNSADTSTGSAENKNNERQRLYQTVSHQCKVCSKTFPTGQALGGHQRLHYKGPTEAPAKPIQQTSPRKHLEIDLNEIPAMEDEEGIYEPSVILTLN